LGLPNQVIEHGARNLILEKYELDPESVRDRITAFMGVSVSEVMHGKRSS
jgi:deoxyxylulose-5-phosphate synthase